jgi:hypothetical protein
MSLIALTKDLPRAKPSGGRGFSPAAKAGKAEEGAEQKWEALTKFIPTELLAPYVAGLSLASAQGWDPGNIYFIFIGATPVVAVLFQFAKAALDKTPWPATLPLIWRAFAAMIAFAVWGLSVPTNPIQMAIGGAAVAGFVALVVSPILTAVEAIALRIINAKK